MRLYAWECQDIVALDCFRRAGTLSFSSVTVAHILLKQHVNSCVKKKNWALLVGCIQQSTVKANTPLILLGDHVAPLPAGKCFMQAQFALWVCAAIVCCRASNVWQQTYFMNCHEVSHSCVERALRLCETRCSRQPVVVPTSFHTHWCSLLYTVLTD